MAKEIAVYIGENGQTASMNEQGKIVVFRREMGKWNILRELIPPGSNGGLKELRNKMGQVLDFLGDCRVFAGSSVTGVPYYELEKAGCSVWEFQGAPGEFLDHVLGQEEDNAKTAAGEERKIPEPIDTGNGCYRFSLKEIQGNSSGMTSKQVLIPFLQKGNFYILELLCSHLPPWLEAEFLKGSLKGEISPISKNEIKVTIMKKTCDEC